MRKYVAEFKVTGDVEQPTNEARETNQIVEKERKFDSKVIGKTLTTGVALTMVASRIYSMYESASNSIVGDSVAQRQFDNRMAYLNEGLSVFGTVGIAALVNPVTAVAAGVAVATSYGLRAIQLGQQNNVKQAGFMVENVINQQKQNRLVKDITGIRI